MNFFAVSGRVGTEPQLKTVGQSQILSFSFAFDTGSKDKRATTWMSCNLWGARAQALSPYIHKGSQLTLGGEISLRPWTSKDGKQGTSLDMNVQQVTLPPRPKDPSPQSGYDPTSTLPPDEVPF